MYQVLVLCHSIVRWFLVIALIYSILTALRGYCQQQKFSKIDDIARQGTVTVAHIQLVIGIILYTQSPFIKHFWQNTQEGARNLEATFFSIIHLIFMLLAIVLMTIGSAMVKRTSTDKQKFKVMLVWFSIALFIILIAVPWPFSPFAKRPYLR